MKKLIKYRVKEDKKLHDFCCHFSAVRSNLMTDVSLKMESTNLNCQMVANVITKHTASKHSQNSSPIPPRYVCSLICQN